MLFTSTNRRQDRRVHRQQHWLPRISHGDTELLPILLNLSPSGARVAYPSARKLPERLRICLQFDNTTLEFEACRRWSTELGEQITAVVGWQFEGLNAEQWNFLRRFCQEQPRPLAA